MIGKMVSSSFSHYFPLVYASKNLEPEKKKLNSIESTYR